MWHRGIGGWKEGNRGEPKQREAEHEGLYGDGELLAQDHIQIRFQEAYEVVFKAIRLDIDDIQVIDLAKQRFVTRDEFSLEVTDDKDIQANSFDLPV